MTSTAFDPLSSPMTSSQWAEWFRANAARWRKLPWHLGAPLSGAERASIARSIAGFQLGESSEGRHLLKAARAYAVRSGDLDYVDAIQRFIAEEQGHARSLARFMDLAGIPWVKYAWSDWVFRRLRRGADLELSIAVLITAELIATIYYAALREATASGLLRALCDKILEDEAYHVRFQSQRLDLLRIGRPRWWIALLEESQRLFMRGTCLVVWKAHNPVLRAGGYTFSGFHRACQSQLASTLRSPRAATYRAATS
jgi:bacterioferritin (cytochrome b1)